jgi:hypothetical protein
MRKSIALLAATAALLLGGCATAPASYPVPRGVSLIDAQRLSTLVHVQEPATGRTRTGTLQVSVPVRNMSPGRLVVEGRATFRGGPASESPSGWRRVFINKDSSETLEFSSLGTQAGDFQVELREGNR